MSAYNGPGLNGPYDPEWLVEREVEETTNIPIGSIVFHIIKKVRYSLYMPVGWTDVRVLSLKTRYTEYPINFPGVAEPFLALYEQ